MTMTTVTVDQLVVSPLNVRINAEDAEETTALEQSIAVNGLLLPLIAHPLDEGDSAPLGVLAGGRRLRALKRLVEAGRLPADYPVPIVVRDLTPAEITELSLAENLLRRALRGYEVHAAIARANDQGKSIDDIAHDLGQRPIWVARNLRLGRLVPEIFEAHERGLISADVLKAYAATEDADLQRAAWNHFSALRDHEHTASRIRAFLKIGDAENERLLRFVDPEVYKDAGGRTELDLFEDGPAQGRVLDERILRDLAESKLRFMREDLCQCTGRDLRFVAQPPQALGFPDTGLELFPVSAEVGNALELPEGEIVVTLVIDADGKAESRFWWASRKAKREAERGPAGNASIAKVSTLAAMHVQAGEAFDVNSGERYAQAARTAVKDAHGLTADGLQAMRSMRREILRAIVADNADQGGSAGSDYIVWAQLRVELVKGTRDKDVGARILASEWRGAEDAEPTDFVAPLLEESWAHATWSRALESLRAEPFMTIENPAEAFLAFHYADEQVKRRAGAVLAGLAMMRSVNTPGWRVAAHDALAGACLGGDREVRMYWEPTHRFVSLFPRMNRLELAQPHVGHEAFRQWNTLTDAVLTSATSAVLLQDKGWVHSLLSFGVANGSANGATRQSESREVAE